MAFVSDENNDLQSKLETTLEALNELREEVVTIDKRDPFLYELDEWIEKVELKLEEME